MNVPPKKYDIKWTLMERLSSKERTKMGLFTFENIYRGPFIYYVITFLGFFDPPPPLRQHVFTSKNKQKLAFSAPPPYKC